ncbi:MAG: hypothetical protein HAW66_00355, partial [Shewanella sp.]|nr:hypothetical protein [Shewanella sp.]
MQEITKDDVAGAIDSFLSTQLQTKLEPILKRQVKEQAESEQAISINAEILALKERFSKDSWLNNAATKMAK